jgi:GNAT superfamily N-acetyltransferase
MIPKIKKTKTLTPFQAEQINRLWNDEYPIKLKDRFPLLLVDVDRYNHYIIEDIDKNIIAWAVDFEKEKQTRFSIIVSAKHRGKGLAKLLIDKLKEENNEFYGWVIDHNDDLKSNGEYYQSPLGFYQKLGIEVLYNIRIDSEMIKAVMIKWSSNK